MAEYIKCRNCESPDCKGCNLKRLETMLENGKFDCMMNENRCINTSADVEPVQEWISVKERLPENFVSVLGYRTDAGEFPPVRECYTVGNAFFFPALCDVHSVSHWCEMPQPPKGDAHNE